MPKKKFSQKYAEMVAGTFVSGKKGMHKALTAKAKKRR